MSTKYHQDVQRACEPFGRDHERLRAELMASLPADAPEGAEPDGHERRPHRIRSSVMRHRILSIGIPAAVAAAVLLAVGLWPESATRHGIGNSGRVYGLADIPNLIHSARVLHLHEWFLIPNVAQGTADLQRRKIAMDTWVDTVNGRWRIELTDLGLGEGSPPPEELEDATYHISTMVSDGEYLMEYGHHQQLFQEAAPDEKTGEFTRLTPFMKKLEMLKVYPEVTAFADRFSGKALDRYTMVGEEEIDGERFEVWESEYDLARWDDAAQKRVYDGVDQGRTRVWLSPTSGNVGRMEHWHNGPSTDQQWVLNEVQDVIECDVEPPPGIFETVPPPEFTMRNSKATAPLRTLKDTCHTFGAGDLEIRFFIQFRLADGSILLAWDSRDVTATASQVPFFENLTPGGPLPALPVEIQALVPENPDCDLLYTGRHLAWTQKDGMCVEWGLFVPPRELPVGPERCARWWKFHYGINADKAVPEEELAYLGIPVAGRGVYDVTGAGEFDELVRGAMAHLSDDGAAPEHVTFDGVTSLSERIRASFSAP